MNTPKYRSRLFCLPEHVIERLEISAKDKGKGGWQNLCAEILESEAPTWLTNMIRDIRTEALQDAVEALQAYRAAEEDEG